MMDPNLDDKSLFENALRGTEQCIEDLEKHFPEMIHDIETVQSDLYSRLLMIREAFTRTRGLIWDCNPETEEDSSGEHSR